MKILGVQDRTIIWSWYITYGAIFVVSAVLQAAASKANLFSNCNIVLVFIFFLLFGWSVLAYGFMVSSIFSKSRIGTYVGIIGFFVMYLITSGFSATTPESTKNAMCIFSPVAMAFGVQTMANAEANSLGITFGNVNEPYQNFRFATSLYYMAFDIVLYTLLGLYFEKVVPKDYGITEKWYFFASPAYWRSRKTAKQPLLHETTAADLIEGAPHDAIEPVGMDLKAQEGAGEALVIRQLRREFKVPGGTKVAVKGLDLTMYKNQITCLLGHNGAGKTTLISMLTGMIPASSGDATFNGLSLRSDLAELRQSLGMCPQHDVLYGELTVEEHLQFYGRIKGFTGQALADEVTDKIAEVGLTEKRNVASSELSGGMKRKLSLAIALLGDSKIVFLDEPTSGMDPYSRRSSWEIIMNNRSNRIVVLTTHFMDEADILGDRIAIMAEGQLRCVGSSLFLKNRYGAGYNFSLVRTEACDTQALIAFVRSYLPLAKVLSNVGTEMSFQLPLDGAPHFAAMFADLDARLEALGVLSYGISVTTLEEVFIKVAEIGDEHQQHTLQPRDPHTPAPVGYKINTAEAPPSRLRMFGRHFVALFKKRFRTARRDKKIVLFGAVLPVIFLILGMCILKFSSLAKDDAPMTINLARYPAALPVPVTCQGDAAWCQALPTAYKSGTVSLLSVPSPAYPTNSPTVFDVTYTNPSIEANDTTGTCLATGYVVYQRGYGAAGATPIVGQYGGYVIRGSTADNTYGYNLIVNTTAIHAAPNFKAAMDETLYQLFTGKPELTLRVTSHPLPLTAMTKTLFTTFMSFATSIFVVLAFAFFTASIVPYLVNEKHHSHNSKHQQLVSGVSLPAFWIANFAWDLLLFMIPCVIGLVAIYLFDITPFTGHDCFGCAASPFAAVIVIFVLLGFSLCSFCYCLSYLFTDPASSQTYTIMTNVVLGTVLMTVSVVLDVIDSTKDINPSLKFIWRLSPLFCVGNSLNALSIYTIRSTFGRQKNNVSAFSTDVVGWEILYLAIEAILFPVLAIGIDYALSFPKIKAKFNKDPQIVDAPVDIDVDVQAEADR
ncbi:ATP-binding Cassette (ABC) Superfamily, partial [Achlya hypogyna]